MVITMVVVTTTTTTTIVATTTMGMTAMVTMMTLCCGGDLDDVGKNGLDLVLIDEGILRATFGVLVQLVVVHVLGV